MYNYELDSIIEDMALAYRTDINHVIDPDSDLSFLDHGFRNTIYESFDYTALWNDMICDIQDTTPISYIDSFNVHYLIFKENLPASSSEKYAVIGGYTTENITELQITELLEENNVPLIMQDTAESFYNKCPIIHDETQWHNLIIRLLHRYYGSEVSIQYRKYDSQTLFHSLPTEKMDMLPNSMERFAELEERYDVERRLIQAVTAGDTSTALNVTNEFMRFRMAPRLADTLRNEKDMIIAVNTLLRKAAEAAYVAPLYIDNLNAKLTVDIEACTTLAQVQSMNSNVIRKYCMLVQTYSRANYHSIVRDILNHIDIHYQNELSLNFFAEKYSVTKNYLSALFHEQVGVTLTDYINSTRIQHSLLLLNTTNISLSDIALACGFNDANYFTRTFKKQKGLTPSEYRKNLR